MKDNLPTATVTYYTFHRWQLFGSTVRTECLSVMYNQVLNY